ncbi:DNA-binding domain-containing protein [Chromobacterium sp. IIBBL 290-4]|uniref:HvfC/BufC N-terminal domain-containing protein n=1 Tax=Chromobacterium sp. IIBBL 290-4 TaxID=2953890 RepID=UPI0020B7885A|nr:DNA-binding domain-containing protein [Chromobacterium sp. IIBBL 290-4]UTH72591.1 putative DNA-binding domain-containing protein [Chromobacterium sp. IIBBL 290-4]
MNWHEWQAGLLEAIADPAQGEAAAALALDPDGLAVYRNNYRVGLIDSLAHSHPVCRQLVGEEFFTALAREYVKSHASDSGNLHRYGERFADFIAGFEPCRDLPYLADVARLEWLAHRAYYAADAEPLDGAALASLAPEQWAALIFTPMPGVALCRADSPALSIWLAHRQDAPLDGILQRPAENALIHRQQGEVQAAPISASRYAFYRALFDGEPLAAALAQAQDGGADFDLQSALQGLFQPPLLASFQLQEDDA